MVVFRTLGEFGGKLGPGYRDFNRLQNRRTSGDLGWAIRGLMVWTKAAPIKKFIDSWSCLGKDGFSCYSMWFEGVFTRPTKGALWQKKPAASKHSVGKKHTTGTPVVTTMSFLTHETELIRFGSVFRSQPTN